ncbi:MAG: 8-oxoguanine deaminase, partial [Actinomycetota bacterium]|nr:8-oxoguanine deaminase [Actinomycetota bacterium]
MSGSSDGPSLTPDVRMNPSSHADLLVRGATLVATCDDAGTEVPGGWVAIRGGVVVEVGTGPEPEATEVLDATGCLVTPGLINTHHHLYQNLT